MIKFFILMRQVFEDLDPDSLFDRLKEETIIERKSVTKTPKPRKVSNEIQLLSICDELFKNINVIDVVSYFICMYDGKIVAAGNAKS